MITLIITCFLIIYSLVFSLAIIVAAEMDVLTTMYFIIVVLCLGFIGIMEAIKEGK